MGDMEKLLLFAEAVGASGLVDVEHVRVCLPTDGPEDCVLLLDGAKHVPPDDLFAQLGQFPTQNSDTTSDVIFECAQYIEEVPESVSNGLKTPVADQPLCSTEFERSTVQANHFMEMHPIDDEQAHNGSPERDLPPKVLFSPMIYESARADHVDSAFAHAEETYHMDVITEPLSIVEEVQVAEGHIDAPSCDIRLETSAVEASAGAPTCSPEQGATSITASSSDSLNLDFQGIIAAHRRRFESFSPQSTLESTCYSGDVVYYWVTQTLRVKDSLALAAAMRLSAELCVPLVALATVDDEVVKDVAEFSRPPATTGKRSIDPVHSDAATDLRCEQNREAVQRKSAIRMAILAHLQEDLRRLHVPLLTVVYNNTNMQNTSTHTITNNSGDAPHQQSGPSMRHVVTPQRKSAPPLHPLATVLLEICGAYSAVARRSTTGSDENGGMPAEAAHTTPTTSRIVHAVSVETVASAKAEPLCSHSQHTSAHNGDAHNSVTHDSVHQHPHMEHNGAVLRPAALFTDDCLHPLHCYVCKTLAAQAPALPIIAVDSNSLQPQAHVSAQGGPYNNAAPSSPMERNASVYLSYESFEKEYLNGGGMDSSVDTWPSVDALKDLLPGWEDADYCDSALQQRLSALHTNTDGAITVLTAEHFKSVTVLPLYGTWSTHCVYDVLHRVTAPVDPSLTSNADDLISDILAYIHAGVLSPQELYRRVLPLPTTHTTNAPLYETLRSALLTALTQMEYRRYRLSQQRDALSISCRKSVSTGTPSWEVSWMDLLSPVVLKKIQQVDQQLSRNTPLFAPDEARRKLARLYASKAECSALNSVHVSLTKPGCVPDIVRVKYWFLYHVCIFGSVVRAISCTFGTLALYSQLDVSHNCSVMLVFVYAVETVVQESSTVVDDCSAGSMRSCGEQVKLLLCSYQADCSA